MTSHVPVLLEECLTLLAPQDGRAYLDCTFGGGGHSAAILARAPLCTIDAMDRDPAAAERSAALLAAHPGRLRFHSENFRNLDRVPGRFDGVLMDIGVSSYQLDVPERGFSFRFDAPNDMRMDTRIGRSAAEFLERGDRAEIERAVRDYGEEPRWFRVVNAIIAARGTGRLARTTSFAELVAEAAPPLPVPAVPTRPPVLSKASASRLTTSSAPWPTPFRLPSVNSPPAACSRSSPSTPSRIGWLSAI